MCFVFSKIYASFGQDFRELNPNKSRNDRKLLIAAAERIIYGLKEYIKIN